MDLAGHLALAVATAFTGAAFYINFAEHPARMKLDDQPALAQWKPSYKQGYNMQATLAILGFLASIWAWHLSGNWVWLLGGVVLVANWPFTLIVIMPTNNILMAMKPQDAGPRSRALLKKWGALHAVRTGLGALSSLIFLVAATQ